MTSVVLRNSTIAVTFPVLGMQSLGDHVLFLTTCSTNKIEMAMNG